MPVLHLVAGSNGAGKSAYVADVLGPATGLPFVNADVIAAEHWPGTEVVHAYEAARLAAHERRARIDAETSFIAETVFSHESKVQLVRDAVARGYAVHLHVVVVPVALTVQRVADRVRRGGHEVPETKIRERHARLWDHVAAAIAIADSATVLDNTSASAPFRVVATFRGGRVAGRPAWPAWTPSALTSAS